MNVEPQNRLRNTTEMLLSSDTVCFVLPIFCKVWRYKFIHHVKLISLADMPAHCFPFYFN